MFGGMLDLCIFLKFGSAACYNTGLKSFKLYKLKPSFSIFKDNKILDMAGVGDKPLSPNFGRSINPNLTQFLYFIQFNLISDLIQLFIASFCDQTDIQGNGSSSSSSSSSKMTRS